MSIGDYCQRHPETATPGESIREAAARMEAAGAGCLMVVDEHQRPIGVVTDRDIVLRGMRRDGEPARECVSDVMSTLTAKAREGTPLSTAVLRMGTDGIRRLPVLDSRGRVAGIFAFDDALRLLARNLSLVADAIREQAPAGRDERHSESKWEVPTARRYHQEPIALGPDASVFDAIDEMEESGVGSIVVIDAERVPIGIVTDRDIMCRVVATGAEAGSTKLGDIMSKDVAFAREDASLGHVLDYAKSRGVRRIPLVDPSGRLVAMVTLDDVIAELNTELTHLSDAVRTELAPFRRRSLDRR